MGETAFKRGDKARFLGSETVEILHGPESGSFGDVYMVKGESGAVVTAITPDLSPIKPEDPRRGVLHGVLSSYVAPFRLELALDAAVEALGAMPAVREPKEGDRVRIVAVYRYDSNLDGLQSSMGELVRVDSNDEDLPYFVKLDDGNTWWCYAVESVEPTPEPRPLAAGDRIRILEDEYLGANVAVGDVLKVTGVRRLVFETECPKPWDVGPMCWTFSLSDEGKHWERV